MNEAQVRVIKWRKGQMELEVVFKPKILTILKHLSPFTTTKKELGTKYFPNSDLNRPSNKANKNYKNLTNEISNQSGSKLIKTRNIVMECKTAGSINTSEFNSIEKKDKESEKEGEPAIPPQTQSCKKESKGKNIKNMRKGRYSPLEIKSLADKKGKKINSMNSMQSNTSSGSVERTENKHSSTYTNPPNVNLHVNIKPHKSQHSHNHSETLSSKRQPHQHHQHPQHQDLQQQQQQQLNLPINIQPPHSSTNKNKSSSSTRSPDSIPSATTHNPYWNSSAASSASSAHADVPAKSIPKFIHNNHYANLHQPPYPAALPPPGYGVPLGHVPSNSIGGNAGGSAVQQPNPPPPPVQNTFFNDYAYGSGFGNSANPPAPGPVFAINKIRLDSLQIKKEMSRNLDSFPNNKPRHHNMSHIQKPMHYQKPQNVPVNSNSTGTGTNKLYYLRGTSNR